MKLFCNGGLMKDDNAPLSSYRQTSDDDSDSKEGGGLFQPGGFWSGILSNVRKSKIPPMKIRMIGSPETRAFVSDRPDLKPSTSQTKRPDYNLNSGPPVAPAYTRSPPLVDETSVKTRIQELTQKALSDSLPQVEEFERQSTSRLADTSAPSKSNREPTQSGFSSSSLQFASLSETLLQSLLKLDGIEIESGWTEARMARKEGVRALQGLLERLDHLKTQSASKQAAPAMGDGDKTSSLESHMLGPN